MPKVVRAVLSLALLAVVYSSVLVLSSVQAAGEDSRLLPDWTLGALGVWAGALLLVSVANMVNAYLGRNEGSASGLALWGMVLKICMIPFYLFGFFWWCAHLHWAGGGTRAFHPYSPSGCRYGRSRFRTAACHVVVLHRCGGEGAEGGSYRAWHDDQPHRAAPALRYRPYRFCRTLHEAL